MTVCARGRLLRKVNKQNKTINKDRHKGMALWSFLLSNCGNLRKRLEALRKKKPELISKRKVSAFVQLHGEFAKFDVCFFLRRFGSLAKTPKNTHMPKSAKRVPFIVASAICESGFSTLFFHPLFSVYPSAEL